MPARISAEDAALRLSKVDYPEATVDWKTYSGWKSPCRFIDSEYGEWWPIPANVANGCKHPDRARNESSRARRTPLPEATRAVTEKHGNEVRLLAESYVDLSTQARFLDHEFGEFLAPPSRVIRGCGHPLRGRIKYSRAQTLSVSELERRVKEVHGGAVRLRRETYRSYGRPAVFIHEHYGEWTALPSNVVDRRSSHPDGTIERIRRTHLRRYGVINPLQSPEFFKKAQRSRWETVGVPRWDDGRELLCRASYEYGVVMELNRRRAAFDWQILFKLSDGRVYYCDLLLEDEGVYVEIKGHFLSDESRAKWEEFRAAYPTAQLWLLKEVSAFTGQNRHQLRANFVEARRKQRQDKS